MDRISEPFLKYLGHFFESKIKFRALLSVYRALLCVYRALLSVYMALLSIYRALLSVYRALLSVHRALTFKNGLIMDKILDSFLNYLGHFPESTQDFFF